jgi:hypothetical protein
MKESVRDLIVIAASLLRTGGAGELFQGEEGDQMLQHVAIQPTHQTLLDDIIRCG